MRKLVSKWGALAASTVLLAALAGCAPGASNPGADDSSSDLTGKVYFILPDRTTVRFEQFDRPKFEGAMKRYAPGIEVVTLNSEQNVQQQLNQVQTAVASDAKAIVMVAVDPDQAAGALGVAAASKVPVICDSHACNGGPAYAYLIAQFFEIGKKHGAELAKAATKHLQDTGKPLRLAKMYGDPKYPFYTEQVKGLDEELEPLVKAGTIQVVCQADALNWIPTNSQQAMDQCLTKTDNGVDAILTMNDDLGGGALAAASSAGVKNVMLYGGYDASLAGVQRVAAGTQAMDMSVSYDEMNDVAAQLAVAAIRGEKVPDKFKPGTYDNGYKGGIPEITVNNMVITKDNLQSAVVDAGLYTKEQICRNSVASDSPFCTK
jgi:D-xylose transport system substrate-binding protein